MTGRLTPPVLAVLALTAACATETTGPAAPGDEGIRPSFAISATGAQIITEAEIARQAENTLPTKNWVLYTRNAGTGVFLVGPGTAPEGVGSMEFNTTGSSDKAYLYNYDYVGKPLSALSTLRYSSYRSAAPGAAVVSLNIEIDKTGGSYVLGDYSVLVFEPYNNSNQRAIQNGVWQAWDAYDAGNGKWWASSGGLPGGTCIQATPCTWTQVLTLVPNATVLGGLGMNQGTGNPGTISAFDQLQVQFGTDAVVTYDFEPYVTATTREICKNSGWQTAKRADGSSFKNQGDCVSYVMTGK
jgi:hypothetical protein